MGATPFEGLPIALNTITNMTWSSPGFDFNVYDNYYRVYIDYNQNRHLAHSEQVAILDQDNSDEVTLTFEVPPGAL